MVRNQKAIPNHLHRSERSRTFEYPVRYPVPAEKKFPEELYSKLALVGFRKIQTPSGRTAAREEI
jgi:hypothetical protein